MTSDIRWGLGSASPRIVTVLLSDEAKEDLSRLLSATIPSNLAFLWLANQNMSFFVTILGLLPCSRKGKRLRRKPTRPAVNAPSKCEPNLDFLPLLRLPTPLTERYNCGRIKRRESG
jgi:hypothetical protein